ncbi:MAG: hypothetical protein IPN85_11360 [Flavobacteriales bacterium]|nr:hypothetical protein [Flavobacteriales bacterium]MBL0036013.1 hypothetical protein [Flavobacteriales bacterium]
MKNRLLSFCLGIGLFTGLAEAQLQRIVLQGTGAPQVFTDINAALAAAQPNDKLYFSGGTFISSTAFTIGMPLHFIGAGVNPDSTIVTSATTIATTSGDIIIPTAATGSTFTGITFDAASDIQYGTSGTDDNPTGILFQRCRFLCHTYLDFDDYSTSSTVYDECIFNQYVSGGTGSGNTTSATFTRCIFDYAIGTGSCIGEVGNLFISHCVFLGEQAFRNSDGAIMENSICTDASYPVYQSNGVTFTNCLFSGTTYTGNSSGEVITNCQLNVPAASIFINEIDNNYQFTDDMHLAPGSGGIGAADDGTDIGIYGSSSPYKPGNVPYNPHFRTATVAPATNPNGDLPVNIHVAAQPN